MTPSTDTARFNYLFNYCEYNVRCFFFPTVLAQIQRVLVRCVKDDYTACTALCELIVAARARVRFVLMYTRSFLIK